MPKSLYELGYIGWMFRKAVYVKEKMYKDGKVGPGN